MIDLQMYYPDLLVRHGPYHGEATGGNERTC